MPENGPERPNTPDPSDRPAWSRLHLWQMQPVRDVLLGLGVVGLFWLGQKISIVTVPLLLAILLAYLFEPVIAWLTKKTSLSRPAAVSSVIVAVVLVVVVPATLGLTYGVIQTVGLAGRITTNTQILLDAFEKETRATNTELAYDAARELALNAPPEDPAAPEREPSPAGIGEDDTELTDVDPTDKDELVDVARRELRDKPPPPTAEEIEDLRLTAAESRDTAANARRRLERLAGDPWPWILGQMLDRHDAHSVDEAIRAVRLWIKDNFDQVAVGTANAGANAIRLVAATLARLFGLGFLLFLTAFFFYFLSTGWAEFKGFVVKLLPDKHKDQITHLAVQFDAVIAGFVRGRLTIAFLQAIVFSLGYWAIGVPAAFILGPAVAVLSIVPYLALVGLPVSVALLWLEGHTGLRGNFLWVLAAPVALYFIGQALDDYVWTPLIQGKQTGLDTPMILFASLAGGALFGVFGLLIAIPIAACAKILIKELVWPKFKDWAEGRAADPLPID